MCRKLNALKNHKPVKKSKDLPINVWYTIEKIVLDSWVDSKTKKRIFGIKLEMVDFQYWLPSHHNSIIMAEVFNRTAEGKPFDKTKDSDITMETKTNTGLQFKICEEISTDFYAIEFRHVAKHDLYSKSL